MSNPTALDHTNGPAPSRPRRIRRAIARATLLAATLLAVSVAAPRAATAASSTCYAYAGSITNASCTTGAIWANSQNHFVRINVASSSRYTVKDAINGVTVATGSSGFWAIGRTITGLRSMYTLRMYSAPWSAYATISNN